MNGTDVIADQEILRDAVARTINCPLSKTLLDVRASVLVEVWRGETITTSLVVSGEAYDGRVRANVFETFMSLPDAVLKIYDGRTLFPWND